MNDTGNAQCVTGKVANHRKLPILQLFLDCRSLQVSCGAFPLRNKKRFRIKCHFRDKGQTCQFFLVPEFEHDSKKTHLHIWPQKATILMLKIVLDFI